MSQIVPIRPPQAACRPAGRMESEWGDVVAVWASQDVTEPEIFVGVWDDDAETSAVASLTPSEAAEFMQLVGLAIQDLAEVKEA